MILDGRTDKDGSFVARPRRGGWDASNDSNRLRASLSQDEADAKALELSRKTAMNLKIRFGDDARVGARQESDHRGDLLGSTEAARGNGWQLCGGEVAPLGVHLCIDRPWKESIHRDAA
jgi:hypothetical protein